MLEARAEERYELEEAEYGAEPRERERKTQENDHKPGGRPPAPPTPGPRDNDQYNLTDPESRIMKNSNSQGFDQHYNAQAVVDHDSLLIVAYKLQIEIGKAIYRLRKCTVEPVIGIIKEVLGFRQFSLRGQEPASCEWCLVCLAFDLKRLHVLMGA